MLLTFVGAASVLFCTVAWIVSTVLVARHGGLVSGVWSDVPASTTAPSPCDVLTFHADGTFKILQFSDMHIGNGSTDKCESIPDDEMPFCSGLNTTGFLRRLLQLEKPDLVVFTGDMVDWKAPTAKRALEIGFGPVIEAAVPWAAVLGNHDEETQSGEGRWQVMEHITALGGCSMLGPRFKRYERAGNYVLHVSAAHNRSKRATLYMIDSGSYSRIAAVAVSAITL